MTELMLRDTLMRFAATFSKSAPSDMTRARIMERTQFIPDHCAASILAKLEERESFPANIGAAIIAAYYDVTAGSNVERKLGCARCDGDGLIRCFVQDAEGFVGVEVAFCDHCHPSHKYRTNRGALLRAGKTICADSDDVAGTLAHYAKHNAELMAQRSGKTIVKSPFTAIIARARTKQREFLKRIEQRAA